MKEYLELERWERKEHFEFFSKFEEPFFGITANVDCTAAYSYSKEHKQSFFLTYLHKALVAANAVEPFRYRIENNQVVLYQQVHASPTINRPNGTFGFAYFDFHRQFSTFVARAQAEIERVQSSIGLVPAISGENVIHFSSVPWINFTALSHARAFAFRDSIPKISFGKMTKANGLHTMPVSIHVHHGLMDGFHVGEFLNYFQEQLNDPAGWL